MTRPPRPLHLTLLLALLVLVARAVSGECGPGENNLIPGCGFDTPDELDGWDEDASVGSFGWEGDEGGQAPGAMDIDAFMLFAVDIVNLECWDVTPIAGRVAEIGASFQDDSSSTDACTFAVEIHSEPNCGGGITVATTSDLDPTGTFSTARSQPFRLPPDSKGATGRIVCSSSMSGFVVLVDDLFLEAALFDDGFENGGLSRWSSSVP